MALTIDLPIYGSFLEAEDYFDQKLITGGWKTASATDKTKALKLATRLIDQLNFKGQKHAIHELLLSKGCSTRLSVALEVGCVTQEEVQDASLSQNTEFPRGDDTNVPSTIRLATYEAAASLLDDVDPEIELENLTITSFAYASVRTTYNRNQVPIEHVINMIPNPLAWRFLKPFLRDEDAIILRRIT